MKLPKDKKELYETCYLKENLISICKEYGLPTTGSKDDLLKYIADFIENKPIGKTNKAKKEKKEKSQLNTSKTKKSSENFEPSLEKIIDKNYSNNEIHREFFKKVINKNFKFNVTFMNWMKENKGKKSYKEAVKEYKIIISDKKSEKKTKIGKQFKYNQYTRDFFKNNPTLSKKDCIKCWNYKKQQKGQHKYEKEDLKIL